MPVIQRRQEQSNEWGKGHPCKPGIAYLVYWMTCRLIFFHRNDISMNVSTTSIPTNVNCVVNLWGSLHASITMTDAEILNVFNQSGHAENTGIYMLLHSIINQAGVQFYFQAFNKSYFCVLTSDLAVRYWKNSTQSGNVRGHEKWLKSKNDLPGNSHINPWC